MYVRARLLGLFLAAQGQNEMCVGAYVFVFLCMYACASMCAR